MLNNRDYRQFFVITSALGRDLIDALSRGDLVVGPGKGKCK